MAATQVGAANDAAAGERWAYSAFISYSRKADATLAPALEQALERFAKPWNRLRALNVFRDDSELSANPALWASIAAALDDSEFFILLASPAAAGSTWVGREVEYWRAHRNVSRLLLVVTAGEVVWEEGARDFDWTRTTALPEALRGAFTEEPRYVDLRWAQGGGRLTLDDDRFREDAADLAATLHGRPKSDMVGEQVRQHRRTIRLARGAIGVLSLLTIAALVAAALAVWQGRVAADQRDAARARELAARASAELDVDPVAAVRLAAAGVRMKPVPEAERALRAALADSRLGASAVLRGHQAGLFSAAFDHAGKRVLTASDDGTARIWDAATGASLAVLRGRPGDAATAVFDRQGKRVVTAGSPGLVRVWDAASGRKLLTVNARLGAVFHAAFDPQGRHIVAAGQGGVRLWDATTGSLVMSVHRFDGWDAAFAPDGARMVTAGTEHTAQVRDAVTGKSLVILRGHSRFFGSAVFDPSGRRILAVDGGGTARVWDAAGARPPTVLRGNRGAVVAAAFDETGARVVTAGADGTARVWNTASGKTLAVLRGDGGGLTRAAFDPAGKRVVAAREDGTTWIWDVATGQAVTVLRGHEAAVVSAAFDSTGTHVVTASADGTARVWTVPPEQPAPVLRADAVSGAAGFDLDGQRLITHSTDGTVRVWDVASWRLVAERRGPAQPTVDGDAATGKRTSRVSVDALAVNRTGSLVAIQGDNSTVRIRDTTDGSTVAVLRGHSAGTSSPYAIGITHAAFGPDGHHLVTVGGDGTARIWDATAGKQVAVLRGHGTVIYSAAFDPTGTRVVTTGQDGTARIWDAATGERRAVLSGAGGPTVFDARGELLLTTAPDGSARVWDAVSGERLAVLRDDQPIADAAISADGRFIITIGRGGTARLHTCRACGRVSDLLAEAVHYPHRARPPASLRSIGSVHAQVLARILGVITPWLALDPSEVTSGARLEKDLGLDYLDSLELVMELEDTFGIRISERAWKRLEVGTVGQVADYIAARV